MSESDRAAKASASRSARILAAPTPARSARVYALFDLPMLMTQCEVSPLIDRHTVARRGPKSIRQVLVDRVCINDTWPTWNPRSKSGYAA